VKTHSVKVLNLEAPLNQIASFLVFMVSQLMHLTQTENIVNTKPIYFNRAAPVFASSQFHNMISDQEGVVKRPELTKYARLDRLEASLRCILTIYTQQRAPQVCNMLGYVWVSITVLK
jgi:hypothetical protein